MGSGGGPASDGNGRPAPGQRLAQQHVSAVAGRSTGSPSTRRRTPGDSDRADAVAPSPRRPVVAPRTRGFAATAWRRSSSASSPDDPSTIRHRWRRRRPWPAGLPTSVQRRRIPTSTAALAWRRSSRSRSAWFSVRLMACRRRRLRRCGRGARGGRRGGEQVVCGRSRSSRIARPASGPWSSAMAMAGSGDDRGGHEDVELVVEGHDLVPLGVVGAAGIAVHRGDRGLDLVRPGRVAPQPRARWPGPPR